MRLIVHCPFSTYGLSGDLDLGFPLPSVIAVRSPLLLQPVVVESSSPDFALSGLLIQLQLFALLPLGRLPQDETLI